jgi:murein hydrolase activator
MEDRLGELIVAELEVRGRLEGASGTVSGVLAALQRISRNPPPALLVDPGDALGSARGAILISAIVPQLQQKADDLIADLDRLDDIKAAALAEEARLKANFEVLEEEQLRIATLIAARQASEERAGEELAQEEAAAAALAAQASSLKQLIDDLTKRAVAVAVAARATAAANAGGQAPLLDPETIQLALANTERREPAVPFAQARGYLRLPSSGVSVIEYGASDGFGGISRGLSIVTRADATVVAPADGWVLYTGDYLNYGKIVILNAGQDYTILLAGLAEISVEIGQFVLMGEPVGTMGSRTIGRTVTTNAGVSRPTLYIEMRRNNEPVDPTGWWAAPETPTQSG